jgi:hypothetical protein
MRIIVLFNLRDGVDPATYEQWARTRDLPGVRSLGSVKDFNVYRVTGLLGSEAAAPYAYSEVIDVGDMDLFWKEVVQPEPQAVAAEFREFLAGEPIFLMTEAL